MIAGALATVLALMLGGAFAVVVMVRREAVTRARLAALAAIAVCVHREAPAVLRSGDVADFIGFLGRHDGRARTSRRTHSARCSPTSASGSSSTTPSPASAGRRRSSRRTSSRTSTTRAHGFPDVAEEALPIRPEHPWGVQNAYVQAAADMGIVGLVLIVWLVLATLVRAGRAALSRGEAGPARDRRHDRISRLRAEWAALGLVPGVPATAFIWFTIGSAVALGGQVQPAPAVRPVADAATGAAYP